LHGGGRRFDPGILHSPWRISTVGETSLVFTRILAATDGTDVALRGVETAAEMAARDGSELLLLTVISMPQHVAMRARADNRTIQVYVERMAQECLHSAVDLLGRMGMGAEVKAVIGEPAETILAEVEASAADLVVMGRRRRYEPKDLILGSVSYRVSRHVKVPILLVP
jgi:nucleotide-binding universal stress UspA family protein